MANIFERGKSNAPHIARINHQLFNVTIAGCTVNGFNHIAQTGFGLVLAGRFLQSTVHRRGCILLHHVAVGADDQRCFRFQAKCFFRLHKRNIKHVHEQQEQQVQENLSAAIYKMPKSHCKLNQEGLLSSHVIAYSSNCGLLYGQ